MLGVAVYGVSVVIWVAILVSAIRDGEGRKFAAGTVGSLFGGMVATAILLLMHAYWGTPVTQAYWPFWLVGVPISVAGCSLALAIYARRERRKARRV